MAKLRPARPKKKAPPQPGAISCVVLIVLGFAMVGLLLYLALSSSK